MFDQTRPSRIRPLDEFQPIRISYRRKPPNRAARYVFLLLGGLLLAYFFGPFRTNILLLGTDDSLQRGSLGRTDTIVLLTVQPLLPKVGLLSIPRDLWVDIPDVGQNRINTAYFFAEAQETGSGPPAVRRTINQNFGVPVHYYALVHMAGLAEVVDALGGIEVTLDTPVGDLPAGAQTLNGQQALAFVRSRTNSDDFTRMQHAQLFLTALLKKLVSPAGWLRLPRVVLVLPHLVETDLPFWQLPRLGFALLRALVIGIDGRSITREMVTPYITDQGAQVLLPNWEVINPVVEEMFH
jgi:LCP family protein required for cell wall assembly